MSIPKISNSDFIPTQQNDVSISGFSVALAAIAVTGLIFVVANACACIRRSVQCSGGSHFQASFGSGSRVNMGSYVASEFGVRGQTGPQINVPGLDEWRKKETGLDELDEWCEKAKDSEEYKWRIETAGLIRNAARNNCYSLDIDGSHLSSLPEEILQLHHLRDLSLYEYAHPLPPMLFKLKKLKSLKLDTVRMFSLPEEIGNLENLRELKVDCCSLNALPKTLGRLSKLKELSLEKNKLTDLPEEVAELKQLEKLDLSHNEFSKFPEVIVKLKCLKSLDLGNNKLSSWPDSIGLLEQLENLDFRNNKITDLPDKIGFNKLEELKLMGNPLSSIPESVRFRLMGMSSVIRLYYDYIPHSSKKSSDLMALITPTFEQSTEPLKRVALFREERERLSVAYDVSSESREVKESDRQVDTKPSTSVSNKTLSELFAEKGF